jgi:GTPase-associated protein 1, N-terminal domain type 1/Effector-associated domain 1
MHALLEWEGDPSLLPVELLGLTDKPPGTYGPSDRWWPSVGCAPLGDWWALWWTLPDEKSRRGGMVRSNVALWPLAEVASVENLRPVMTSLGGADPIPAPPTGMLESVAEGLLSQEAGRPILQDLDAWPGILAALWERLWPNARRMFSARVAISPPQGGDSVSPPWLFCIPRERSLQWSGHRLVSPGSPTPGPLAHNRAVRWLMGARDSTLEEVVGAYGLLSGELKFLTRVARAADGLERYRATPTAEHALSLLRTLIALAPKSEVASLLKGEALDVLEKGLAGAQLSLVLAIANLDIIALPTGSTLENALGGWVGHKMAELSTKDALGLLEKLERGRAQIWWQQAVRQAVVEGLTEPDSTWAAAVLRWLGTEYYPAVLEGILPNTGDIEQRLLEATNAAGLDESAAKHLRERTLMRGWSRLHAWSAMRSLAAKEAFQAQRTFPTRPLDGLALLVDFLPGTVVVEEAISRPDDQILRMVACRTVHEPALLDLLDVSHSGWRALWAEHLALGGRPWPSGTMLKPLAQGVLDAVLAGDPSERIIVPLAADLADIALSHPRRSELWDALSASGRAALLPLVAIALIGQCEAGHFVAFPESTLADAVINTVRKTPPSAKLLAVLLQWDVALDERNTLSWLYRLDTQQWSHLSRIVGQAAKTREWRLVAMEIYRKSRYTPELRPAMEACLELLPEWERWSHRWLSGALGWGDADDAPLVRRVADVGANLAPDGLDELWERAGGERRQLPRHSTPRARWNEAAQQAHVGALHDGLLSLVWVLAEDFPHNENLKELAALIERKKRAK